MKRSALAATAVAAVLAAAHADAQAFTWTRRMGGTAADSTYEVSLDPAGNAYVAGMFRNTASFGGFCAPLTSAGDFDIFYARYAPGGTCVWARRAGGAGYDAAYDINIDAGGRLYVTGMFTASAAFPTGTTTTTTVTGAQQDVFLARVSIATGNATWVRTGGGAGLDMGRGVASDAAGNAYLTGYVSGPSTWGMQSVAGAGGSDAFVAAYTPAGALQWVRGAGGPLNDAGQGIAVGPAGEVYVTGFYAGAASFGQSVSLTTTAPYNAFLARYTGAGAAVWAVDAGAPAAAWGNAVSVRPGTGASVYVAGRQAPHTPSMFVGSYSPTGAVQWVRVTPGPADALDVAANAVGATLVTGWHIGAATFAGGTSSLVLPGGAGGDAFAVQYDAAGEPVWARGAGGAGFDSGLGVDVGTGAGGVGYLAGAFAGTATWGPLLLSSAGNTDGFLSRLGCMPPPTGMRGWWAMDATALDQTANANHGTLAGTAAFAPGRVNQGLVFNGGTGALQVPDAPSLDILAAGTGGAGNFSIDFWVRVAPAAAGGVRTVLDKRQMTPTLQGYHVALFNGVPLLQIADASGFTNYSAGAGFGSVADGSWHFVAVTVNRQSATGIRWYRDGQPAGTSSNPLTRPGTLANTAALLIGNHQTSPTSALVGSLDELEIFNRVLTAQQVAALSAAPYGKCR
jgi:hypothetical protein